MALRSEIEVRSALVCLSRSWKSYSDDCREFFGDARCRGENRVAFEEPIASEKIIHAAAGFFDENEAGETVPGVHVGFKAAIDASDRYVRNGKRS